MTRYGGTDWQDPDMDDCFEEAGEHCLPCQWDIADNGYGGETFCAKYKGGLLTSIIILTHNQLDFTKLCVESIRKYSNPKEYELIIVDNDSNDGTRKWLTQQSDVRTIFNNQNLGFPKGCNQGIEIAEGAEILLLNNDTVVTVNWLNNMRYALYSDEQVGAVGPTTNYCSDCQAIIPSYSSLYDMDKFAYSHNKSNPELWEDRLKLVGFCLLIKRKVVTDIGLLDEVFSPGNYEDDDYSVRMVKAGYRLILCKDTFIHHFGSVSFKQNPEEFSKILRKNAKVFEKKWGFNPAYSLFIRNEIIDLIDRPKNTPIKVLEIGCGCGCTLLQIKNIFRYATVYGVELNKNAAAIAETFAQVFSEDIETESLPFKNDFFDYIILADVLEHLKNPWDILKQLKCYLKLGGYILASIPNIMHFTVVRDLLNGQWTYKNAGILDRTHLRFFTLHEIHEMFISAGYNNMVYGDTTIQTTEEDEAFVRSLASLGNEKLIKQYKVYQYIVRAQKTAKTSSKPTFVTIFPETENVHLTKDVGMIPFIMQKYYGYDSTIVCYKNGEYPYLDREVKGLNIDYLNYISGSENDDVCKYLEEHSAEIDILHLFHLSVRTLKWINTYNSNNPQGKIYLKLDADIKITNLTIDGNPRIMDILKKCDLISVETLPLYYFLKEYWPIKVEYIPNGYYDFSYDKQVRFEKKDNIICTVGRIGLPVKATEILMEAFRLAEPRISNWKLRIVGPVLSEFDAYIDNYFEKYPHLSEKVIFTGEIVDKHKLEREYDRAKVFCLTSRIESFALVLVEAARRGCFLITSNIISANDITSNGKYGDIFEVDNIGQLKELIIQNCNSQKKLNNNCNAVEKFIKNNFNWVDICGNINQLLTGKRNY
ncbi:glycosyltransferase [Pelosinus sp. IPA-1]|uniref:glycosyltransferase n=1 Tax=Pelosinus sp. IPA-1 TaxID=3029569 RepID=UPI0024361505|nr:glycosyltransferase [Pelosinus sp. IPA-1]GMB00333.1 hypothetical protein PIPA1_31320 [Pelosinus sp. IPA-1]